MFDFRVVAGLGRCRHLGGDQPRLHLVDPNAFIGQTHREQTRGHGQTSLGNAVFASQGRHRMHVGGGDGDDAAMAFARRLRFKTAGKRLGQKERTAGVDLMASIKALRGDVKQVAP
ncbi:hypothetical protein D3C84_1043130 [compost metagenome]